MSPFLHNIPVRNAVAKALTRWQIQYYQDLEHLKNDDYEMILLNDRETTRVLFNEAQIVEIDHV